MIYIILKRTFYPILFFFILGFKAQALTAEDFKHLDKIQKIQRKMLDEIGTGNLTMTLEEVNKVSEDPAGDWSNPMTAGMLNRYKTLLKNSNNWIDSAVTDVKKNNGYAIFIKEHIWDVLAERNYAQDEDKESFQMIYENIKNYDADNIKTFNELISQNPPGAKQRIEDDYNQEIIKNVNVLYKTLKDLYRRDDTGYDPQLANLEIKKMRSEYLSSTGRGDETSRQILDSQISERENQNLIKEKPQRNMSLLNSELSHFYEKIELKLKMKEDEVLLNEMAEQIRKFKTGQTTTDEVASALGSPSSSNIIKKLDGESWVYKYNPGSYSVKVEINFTKLGRVISASVLKSDGGAESELFHLGNP